MNLDIFELNNESVKYKLWHVTKTIIKGNVYA